MDGIPSVYTSMRPRLSDYVVGDVLCRAECKPTKTQTCIISLSRFLSLFGSAGVLHGWVFIVVHHLFASDCQAVHSPGDGMIWYGIGAVDESRTVRPCRRPAIH